MNIVIKTLSSGYTSIYDKDNLNNWCQFFEYPQENDFFVHCTKKFKNYVEKLYYTNTEENENGS